MTDLFDLAQALEQRQREEALARQAERAAMAAASYSHCQDCGDGIPAPRQRAAAGCRRCLICQQNHEKGLC